MNNFLAKYPGTNLQNGRHFGQNKVFLEYYGVPILLTIRPCTEINTYPNIDGHGINIR